MESLLTKTYSPPHPDNDAITNESNGKAALQVPSSIRAWKTNKPSSSLSTKMAGTNDWERAEEGIGITPGELPIHHEPPSPRSDDAPVENRSSGLALHSQSRELHHEDRASYEMPNICNSPVTNCRSSGALQERESSSTEAECGGQRSRIDEGQRSNVASEGDGQMLMVDIEEGNDLISRQELKTFELLDISEFESDSSDSLLEVAFPASVSTACAAAVQSTSSVPTATTEAGSSSAQLNQSKILLR